MPQQHLPLFSNSYLAACWRGEYQDYLDRFDSELLDRLRHWVSKDLQKETTAESTFVDVFFKRSWGFRASGEGPRDEGYTCRAQAGVAGGGKGEADLALGLFDNLQALSDIPQAMCEFKGVTSDLDKPQNRKGNTRSPVKQCFDYLKSAAEGLYGHESIRPTWGIVTNMDEFRLYHLRTGPSQYQRFSLTPIPGAEDCLLLGDDEDTRFRRFLFWKMFQHDVLLSSGGKSLLEQVLSEQWVHEKKLEKDFYREYHAFRDSVFQAIVSTNPSFTGSRGTLVRLTQRFLDRCIFVLCCEDMGAVLNFPKDLLRDILAEVSNSKFFNPDDNTAWEKVKHLFDVMRDGGSPFGGKKVNRFNGGLFEVDPVLETLKIPTRVFCAKGQGASEAELRSHADTLLYFAAAYNFGVDEGGRERAIGLYALGRIFEQSITDLEKMEAEADNRVSLAKLSKRKSDGVYYTPEWVTQYIVQEVVGARLRDLKREVGLPEFLPFSDDDLSAFRRGQQRSAITGYLATLDQYAKALDRVTVVDPACGSGAFLIQAFNYLLNERTWISHERWRISGTGSLFDLDAEMRSVLTNNIFGVDINQESVEITKLALWLRTALPDRPLSVLDDNIRCGNSLVEPDFYARNGKTLSLFDENKRELINAFDWREAFPAIFARGGFDCIVGNPPYVKLQHLKVAQPEVAEYLANGKEHGSPRFASTQTGNFDLYLPFIERGLLLLGAQGRMGFIAPNLWTVNEYGAGLRELLSTTRQLERWVDFKSFQVFEEAITYTALQFFTKSPNDAVQCVFLPTGQDDLLTTDWATVPDAVPYAELLASEPWWFMTNEERALLKNLRQKSITLQESCKGIIVGIQTSADDIYHLERLAPGRYRQHPKNTLPIEVEIEDALMHPLVSGTEIKRYQKPLTSTFLLFPYDLSSKKPRLWTKQEMSSRFPQGWHYLTSHESALRAREESKMDANESWWAYNYPKNLDKQELPKLMIPRLAMSLSCSMDSDGEFYLDNVDVNGIIVENNDILFYLAGILNSPVANFVWRRISKPFQNDYRSANKQFIAPLPIPVATKKQKIAVGKLAKELQARGTEARDALIQIGDILDRAAVPWKLTPAWLWPDVHDVSCWKKACTTGLKGAELTTWAKHQLNKAVEPHLEDLRARLRPGASWGAESAGGRLTLLVDEVPVIVAYPDATPAELDFAALQWRFLSRAQPVTDRSTACQLLGRLLTLRWTDNSAALGQLAQLDARLLTLAQESADRELRVNDLIYDLFDLTREERRYIEGG
jgi:hypothetical protein